MQVDYPGLMGQLSTFAFTSKSSWPGIVVRAVTAISVFSTSQIGRNIVTDTSRSLRVIIYESNDGSSMDPMLQIIVSCIVHQNEQIRSRLPKSPHSPSRTPVRPITQSLIMRRAPVSRENRQGEEKETSKTLESYMLVKMPFSVVRIIPEVDSCTKLNSTWSGMPFPP